MYHVHVQCTQTVVRQSYVIDLIDHLNMQSNYLNIYFITGAQ